MRARAAGCWGSAAACGGGTGDSAPGATGAALDAALSNALRPELLEAAGGGTSSPVPEGGSGEAWAAATEKLGVVDFAGVFERGAALRPCVSVVGVEGADGAAPARGTVRVRSAASRPPRPRSRARWSAPASAASCSCLLLLLLNAVPATWRLLPPVLVC